MRINKYLGSLITIMLTVISVTVKARTDSLQVYMFAAARNNPAVIAAYKNYQAAMQRIVPAGTLSNPELSLEFYPKPMELINGKQVMSVSLMQMFPWLGTFKAAKSQKSWMAEAAYQKYRAEGIDIVFQVQELWYKMIAIHEQVFTIDENIRLLKSLEDVALYKYKTPITMYGKSGNMSGSGKMSDQMRIKAERVKLEEQIESVRSQFELMKRQFNLLLHRDENSPLIIPDSVELSQMPVIKMEEIKKMNPVLSMWEAERQSYISQAKMAKKMGMPTIGIGVGYMFNKKRDLMSENGMNSMNGMNMFMLMAKVSIPIYRKKVHAQQKEAALMEKSAEENYVNQVDALRSRYLSVVQQAEDTRRKIKLYDKESDILGNTLKLMQTEYTTGSSSLTDILQIQHDLIDFALKRFEAIAVYNTIVATYEKLVAKNDYNNK